MNSKPTKAEVVFPMACKLGESAVWRTDSNEFAFVDIDDGDVHWLNVEHPLVAGTINLGGWVSAALPASDGRLLVTAKRGVGLLETETNGFDVLYSSDDHLVSHRYNDAKCDRDGRLLVGTMSLTSPRTPTGRLYQMDGAERTLVMEGLRTPNAICFSPDGSVMYICDTADGVIWRLPYDGANGAIGKKEVFAAVDIAPGKPDGATVDAEGCVWSARYNGGSIVRITPDGRVDQIIELPVTQITSCAFGGRNLDTLFITTARQNLDADVLRQQPLAGSIFAAKPEVGGIAESPFKIPTRAENNKMKPGSTGT